MKKLPDSAKEREAMGAEFWKPKKDGEQIWGKVVGYENSGKYGPTIIIAPAVIFSAKGKGECYHSMSLGLNAILRKRISQDSVSDCIAVKFTGLTKTANGKMKLYEVFEIAEMDLQGELDALDWTGEEDGEEVLPF